MTDTRPTRKARLERDVTRSGNLTDHLFTGLTCGNRSEAPVEYKPGEYKPGQSPCLKENEIAGMTAFIRTLDDGFRK